MQGNRADSGLDELGLAFLIDEDLTAILNELEPDQGPVDAAVPRDHGVCGPAAQVQAGRRH